MENDFPIDDVLARIEAAIAPFPKAALWELYEGGHTSLFEQLLACIISIRTRDEAMVVIAQRLFDKARTPAAVAALPVEEIDALIRPSTFHERKAAQIRAIAERTLAEHGGELPCDFEVLTGFSGVGPKCANLALGLGCGMLVVGVDIHVHRVTNRWGYVSTSSPEQTMRALQEKLPPAHHLDINRLLVPFGKHICTGTAPRCSTCPVREPCAQVGVTRHR